MPALPAAHTSAPVPSSCVCLGGAGAAVCNPPSAYVAEPLQRGCEALSGSGGACWLQYRRGTRGFGHPQGDKWKSENSVM